jgi:RNA polymerase sigma-70 factor, ECF subfamily
MMVFVFALTLDAPNSPEAVVAADEEAVQQLVERARGGDRAAAGRLYRLHAQRVFRAVRPLCSHDAEAEEVVQDTFVKALSALGRYRRQGKTRFVTWLLTIALNQARGARRRRPVTLVPTEPADMERIAPQTEAAGDSELGEARRAALLTALAELPARDREIITLRYGADLSAAEVARLCRLREANVRKICQRRRDQLLTRVKALVASTDSLPIVSSVAVTDSALSATQEEA